MARTAGLGTHITVTFLRQGLGLVLGLALAALVARTLGPDGQGKYALAVLLVTLVLTIFNLGVPAANVYFLGRGEVSVAAVLRTNVRISLLLGAAGGMAGAFVIFFLADSWFPGVPEPLLWIALVGFPFALLQSFFVSLLQGLQDFNRYNLVLLVQPFLALALTALAVLVFDWGIAGALAAYVVSLAIDLGVAWYACRRHLRATEPRTAGAPSDRYAARCVAYGWKALIGGNLAFFSYRSGHLLLNYFINPASTGVYAVAVAIAEKIWMLSLAVSSVLLPRLSELHTDEAKRRRLTPLATRTVFAASCVVAIVLFAGARPLIVYLFGAVYEEAVGALRWLLPGVLMLAVAKGVGNDLAARGRVDINLGVAAAVVAVSIVLNVVLIPRYGVDGAAMAATFSYGLNMIIGLVIYRRITGNRWYTLMVFQRRDFEMLRGKLESLKRTR